jgi:hypothetical protein
MSNCPIFQATSAMIAIGTELYALVGELKNQLAQLDGDRIDFDHQIERDSGEKDDWACRWAVFDIPFTFKGARGRRKQRYISVRFDLTRDHLTRTIDQETWPHARQALLVVGHDPSSKNWEADEMEVRADGRLKSDVAWTSCKDSIHHGWLLEWQDASIGERWDQKCWLFAVPIIKLSTPETLNKQVSKVIGGLLANIDPAEGDDTIAVSWQASPLA